MIVNAKPHIVVDQSRNDKGKKDGHGGGNKLSCGQKDPTLEDVVNHHVPSSPPKFRWGSRFPEWIEKGWFGSVSLEVFGPIGNFKSHQ